MKPWPYLQMPYYNACVDPCDALEGPCCCGATHMEGEFNFIPLYFLGSNMFKMTLWRFGKVVDTAMVTMNGDN